MPEKNEPIAVVGTGCRFPGGSSNPSKLWELLEKPVDVLSRIDRFNAENFYHPNGHHHGASNVRDAYLLSEDPKTFDAQFFNISASEADNIDPQHRLLLESVYEGLESAGISLESLQGSPTAVYVGVMCDDYTDVLYNDGEAIPTYAATGSARSILSNRISYFFDWHGPSMTIDTACSSSLIAVHQGVQVLRSGESRVAIAGGANLIFGPKMFMAESNLNMLSATGRSQMWDADANGYARGEGVAAVVMKTLSSALADGDHIEYIIRETGINQDGRTMGITMPSSTAQAALIAQTYARAGLDPSKATDRCQYFEAHGTGTKAGDPQEARAIHTAFFSNPDSQDENDKLLVGSIKTIIGHTEGTAGLAGLIKASLAIQNKTVPPNLLFKNLNPDIEPYYGRLRIPQSAIDWPPLPEGVPRRASVNSFGFGGANAHAIIENYQPNDDKLPLSKTDAIAAVPFLFSATSEKSLQRQLTAYLKWVEENPKVNARDLSLTMTRKSAFSYRTSLAATSMETLGEKLKTKLEEIATSGKGFAIRPIKENRRILGVFTGQGAQWSSMGAQLLATSAKAAAIIKKLEKSLDTLPEADRPTWKISEEMTADSSTSRIAEAALSQPLCTAVQVVLVDILREAGINFTTVVGHSSGEIGACYAAGLISAEDAIRIAYYRGLLARYASAPTGARGVMMAVGTSMEDADELCKLPPFPGRLTVAACNSSASVTVSGDADAVDHAEIIFKDEAKFARKLKVDTAYHSHHMLPCSAHYLKALSDCQIKILTPPEDAPAWYSSVSGGDKMTTERDKMLQGTYWVENMVKPVLFSQALEAALNDSELDPALAMEVGPHPALQGPASLTIEETIKHTVPYIGTLSRGKNDTEALALSLGLTWSNLADFALDFKSYDELFSSSKEFDLLKGLPSYTWDKDRSYWYESRAHKALRTRKEPTHELLGVRIPEEAEGEFRWRNILKPNEVPWLRGHEIQGQKLFPAAGFAALAFEASRSIVPRSDVRLLEIQDFIIHRAMAFNDEATGVEIIIKLSNVERVIHGNIKMATAEYECLACTSKETGLFTLMASAKVQITLGKPSESVLPAKQPVSIQMTNVDVEGFYDSLNNIGYNYSDMFRGISSLARSKDVATGTMYSTSENKSNQEYYIHPGPLDVAFQAVFAAISSPGDGSLWTIHVPTVIKRIQVNPSAMPALAGLETTLSFDAVIGEKRGTGVSGDVVIYNENATHSAVQIDGLHVTPLSAAQVSNDRSMFCFDAWGTSLPDAEKGFKEWQLDTSGQAAWQLVERLCLFYLKQLHETVTEEEKEDCDEHQIRLLHWAKHVIEVTAHGKHPICKSEWLEDSFDALNDQMKSTCEFNEEISRVVKVGELLIPFVRCEASMQSFYDDEDMLNHLHSDAFGLSTYQEYLGDIVCQLTHRHQNSTMLEIGAGSGASTASIMEKIGINFASYTLTDISEAAIDDAQQRFTDHGSRFIYKTLDIDSDFQAQGFSEATYDIIVASNVFHASVALNKSLKTVRSLLKPGGWLVVLEKTNTKSLYSNFVFSGSSAWWSVEDEDRKLTPLISLRSWDVKLRDAGFAGVDTSTPDVGFAAVPFSIMVAQAVDAQMNIIRNPFTAPSTKPLFEELLVVGGENLRTSRLRSNILGLVSHYCQKITFAESVEDLEEILLTPKTTVLCLAELDTPLFKIFTPEKLRALQTLVATVKTILWVIQGSKGENPHANMIKGVARCWIGEIPDLKFQSLDFDFSDKPDARIISECLLRMQISGTWKRSGATAYTPTWPMETEYHYSNSTLYIPRIVANQVLNHRYNSRNRTIRREISTNEEIVALVRAPAAFDVQECRQAPTATTDFESEQVLVQIKQSTLYSIKVKASGYLYLLIGNVCDTNQKVLAFSSVLRSKVAIFKSWIVPCDVEDSQEASLLFALSCELLAEGILSNAKGPDAVLVHEARPQLAQALKRRAVQKNIYLTLTTSQSDMEGYTFVHPETPNLGISAVIPTHLATYVNFGENALFDRVGSRFTELVPPYSKVIQGSSLSHDRGYTQPGNPKNFTRGILEGLQGLSALSLQNAESELDIEVKLADVPHIVTATDKLMTVSWTAEKSVLAKIVPAEEGFEFANDKTYLLVGLTGDLGLSLCRWMVEHGAKYIALTSRNPKVSQEWLDLMERRGATIKIYSMDVTDKESIDSVVEVMRSTMPKVGGVANGAMVLIDHMFNTTTYENFEKTLKPKVDGTILLDNAFQEKDLDFFICFSSLAFVSGNIGQTSYAAANGFMASLVNGRRKRGLAASVIHMAGIFGLGYVERTDRKIISYLERYGFGNISEWDFHQFFAEAVVAGRPQLGLNPEIASNMLTFDPEKDAVIPAWIDVPRFSHFKLTRPKTETAAEGGQTRHIIRPLLAEATTLEEVQEILFDGLRASLARQLNLPSPDDITSEQAVVELGVDSLIAVDLRAWFTKELEVDMPVLKILGGATLGEVVEDTYKRLPRDLVPKLAGGETEEAVAEEGKEDVAADSEAIEDAAIMNEEESSPEISVNDQGEADTTPNAIVEEQQQIDSDLEESTQVFTPQNESHNQSVDDSVSSPDTESIGSKEVVQEYQSVPKFIKVKQMSYGSSRFWFLDQYLKDPTTFNLCFRTKFSGPMDVSKLENAVLTLGERHEVFRSAFFADFENMNEPSIGVMKSSSLSLEKMKVKTDQEAIEESDRMLKHVFDLAHGETIRIKLMALDANTHYITFATHHMAFDGFSFNVLLSELSALYGDEKLGPVETQFPDFGELQREQVDNGSMDGDIEFWKEEFSTFPEPLPLFPVVKTQSRPNMSTYDYEEALITLDAKTSRMIRDQSRRYKSTAFHYFLAVYKTFLFRFLDTDDLAIGMADANRTETNLISTVGFLLNLLALRFKANSNQSFNDAVTEVRNKTYAAIGHSKLPFDVLLERLQVPRSSTHSPIFQAFIDYRALKREGKSSLGELSEGVGSVGRTGYDIVLDINDKLGDNFKVSMRCQKSLYSKEATNTIFDSFIRLLKVFSNPTKISPSTVQLYDPITVRSALKIGRATRLDSEWATTVSQQVDLSIEKRPDMVALKDGTGRKLTYQEMGQRVNSIGNSLLDANLGDKPCVAVFQHPGTEWICSVLAIWKIGGTYIPLDGRSGLARLASIAQNAPLAAIVCDAQTAGDVPSLVSPAKAVNVDEITTDASVSITNLAQSDSPAVIQFTSGSTGVPKGIVLLHSNIQNWTEGSSKAWNLGPEMVLQHSAYTFDLSLDQMLLALTHGGTLYVATKEERESPAEMAKIIHDQAITYTMATPSEYSTWIQYGADHLKAATKWTSIWSGGEALTKSLVRDFKSLGKPDLRLYNAWGPSEVTFSCTKAEIDWRKASDGDDIIMPIGKPLPNYSVQIVDRDLEPVPAGVSGEVLVGGAGVTQGYLNNEELTKASFIQDKRLTPEYAKRNWTRLYRTGDQGYLRADGTLVFQKRIGGDTQIKLRGIRIELGDIESSIIKASDDNIIKCVATARGDPKFLMAHVQFAPDYPKHDQKRYADELLSRLPVPHYMRPAAIIPLAAFPLNGHNKTDRRAVAELPLQEDSDDESTNEKWTPTEAALAEIWLQIVSPEIAAVVKIRGHTDFFQAGGNSLLLVKLQVLVRERFGVSCPMTDLYQSSTLRSMAARIEKAETVADIEWAEETAVQEDLPSTQSNANTATSDSEGMVVILTGATGFLGKQILQQLVADSSVFKIHCVAIRQSGDEPRRSPITSDKIVLHYGDFTLPRFGLSAESFDTLAQEADVVLHSGANRAFWDQYHLLKDINFAPTKELARLAAVRNTPIHFISSGGVLDLADSDAGVNILSVREFKPPVDGSMGYIASKWASEVYLENLSNALNIPVHIHRVTPAAETSEPTEEMLEEFGRVAMEMKALPMQGGWGGCFDLIKVETLAKKISSAAVARASSTTQSAQFYHYPAEMRLRLGDVMDEMEEHTEITADWERLQPEIWVGEAKKAGLGYHLASMDFTILGSSGEKLTLTR